MIKQAFRVRLLQWPINGDAYLTSWDYPTLATAQRYAKLSGLSAAPIPSYPNGQRLGRVWIEDPRRPATCHRDYEWIRSAQM